MPGYNAHSFQPDEGHATHLFRTPMRPLYTPRQRGDGITSLAWVVNPVKIALTAWYSESGWDGDTICRQAERAETMGFHSHRPAGGEGTRLAPLPVQRPHPPLWVAAFGPLALKQAGGLGLPYLCSPIEPLEDLVANVVLHRNAAEAAGQRLEETMPVMRTVFISPDASAVARVMERLAASVPTRLRGEGVAVEDWAIVGDRHYVRDRLAEYRTRLGVTHLIGGGRLPIMEENLLLQSHQWLAEMGEGT